MTDKQIARAAVWEAFALLGIALWAAALHHVPGLRRVRSWVRRVALVARYAVHRLALRINVVPRHQMAYFMAVGFGGLCGLQIGLAGFAVAGVI